MRERLTLAAIWYDESAKEPCSAPFFIYIHCELTRRAVEAALLEYIKESGEDTDNESESFTFAWEQMGDLMVEGSDRKDALVVTLEPHLHGDEPFDLID